MGSTRVKTAVRFYGIAFARMRPGIRDPVVTQVRTYTWNFQTLTMQFMVDEQQVTLSGVHGGTVQFATKNQLAKMSLSIGKGTCTMLVVKQPTLQSGPLLTNKALTQEAILELQEVLEQFFVIFGNPVGLPPRRDHDH